ncbi:Anti-sigma-28 factor, FlgM [Caloramator mitchellensis]|uniref:Negative regulator of flagellin synthesis n=1 Tax=Caloramator mitchellensis TaxID=908809 RepID=A0A0R3JR92_CALMK|nr:flagellar biosynthesis anti-sigma factor FlgM [Caloramator mitchellensis]KRQ85991.1 Anti-sigma-28 factor, FlgM [Caloramator mitchellensis]
MKVRMDVNNVINVYNSNAKKANSKENVAKKSDTIEISKAGKEIAKFLEIAKTIDVDSKDIEKIKSLIKEGNYKVDEEKLAKSIMDAMKESDK